MVNENGTDGAVELFELGVPEEDILLEVGFLSQHSRVVFCIANLEIAVQDVAFVQQGVALPDAVDVDLLLDERTLVITDDQAWDQPGSFCGPFTQEVLFGLFSEQHVNFVA